MKQEIIRKTLILLGVNTGNFEGSGTKLSKAEHLCEEFITSAIEETFLVGRWPFALKMAKNQIGKTNDFTLLPGVEDCLKVAVINPSNLEWYIEGGRFCFKGARLDTLFYYSKAILQRLLANDKIEDLIPESFRLLCSLSLVGQVAFALYSDSLFVESFRKQYLLKLNEVKQIYALDYNLVNAGEI